LENTHEILLGGLEHDFIFHILGIMIPTDFHIFHRGGSTTNQIVLSLFITFHGRCKQVQAYSVESQVILRLSPYKWAYKL
jgi:hypothetical protein